MAATPTRRQLLAALALPDGALRVPPRPAAAFTDSVGVNTHLESPPYATDPAKLLARLRELGIRHLRDELRPSNDFSRWRALADAASLRFDLLVSPATNTQDQMLAAIQALGPQHIDAIEGQNEGDSDWFQSQPAAGSDWAHAVLAYHRATARALRAAGLPIPLLSPTVLDYKPDDMARLRAAATLSDIVALHAYAQGDRHPETTADYAALDWYRSRIATPFKPGAPIMVTECGYATGTHGIPPDIAARYLPRLLLHNFAAGIRRTYLYELMDEGADPANPEQNYGLLTEDFRPKPAFETLRLLLAALADPGPPYTPDPAALTLSSDQTVRHSLFARRDGALILAAWRPARSWDPEARKPLPVAPATLHVRAPGRRAAALRLTKGAAPIPLPTADATFDMQVDDTVSLLTLL